MRKPWIWLLPFALFAGGHLVAAPAGTGGSSTPAGPAGVLAPGALLTVEFPEMPPTFYAVQEKKDLPAKMTVFLPRNYTPAGRFPVLVFLNGWNGGTGADLGVARSLCEDRDFVCVSVPLWKIDPSAADIVMRDPDAAAMWPQFQTMLAKLDGLVPNLDRARWVLGGFSNGAHAAQGLIDMSKGEVARRFSAVFFVEGGGRLTDYGLLKDKPFLMVSSNVASLPRSREIAEAARQHGADVTLVYENVGKHDFPTAAYPSVRAWLRSRLPGN